LAAAALLLLAFAAPMIAASTKTQLSGAGVSPRTGTTATTVHFDVVYQNASGARAERVAVVVGGVTIAGGSGTVAGAALGALFLALINNALLVLGLPQEPLLAIYGAVILVAVSADAVIRSRARRDAARSRVR